MKNNRKKREKDEAHHQKYKSQKMLVDNIDQVMPLSQLCLLIGSPLVYTQDDITRYTGQSFPFFQTSAQKEFLKL